MECRTPFGIRRAASVACHPNAPLEPYERLEPACPEKVKGRAGKLGSGWMLGPAAFVNFRKAGTLRAGARATIWTSVLAVPDGAFAHHNRNTGTIHRNGALRDTAVDDVVYEAT